MLSANIKVKPIAPIVPKSCTATGCKNEAKYAVKAVVTEADTKQQVTFVERMCEKHLSEHQILRDLVKNK
jgi:hypothetical protein